MINLMYLALSLAARVVSGVIVTVLVARALDPAAFGTLMLAFAVGGTASILADLGSSSSALREIGERPGDGGKILGAALSAKGALLLASIPIYGLIAYGTYSDPSRWMASCIIYLAACFASLSDLSVISFRALGRNAGELANAVATSALTVAVFLLAIPAGRGIVFVASLFLLTRMLTLGLSLWMSQRLTSTRLELSLYRPAMIFRYAQRTRHWALSSILAYFNSQLDSILVTPLLGAATNGLYQSVVRFLSIATQMPSIAINFWVPRIARSRAVGGNFRRLEVQATVALVGAGVGMALVFGVLGPLFTATLLPRAYAAASILWWPVAILAFSRFCAAASVVWLISANRPSARTVGEALAFVFNLGGLVLIAPKFGLVSVPLVLTGGAMITCACSAYLARRYARAGLR